MRPDTITVDEDESINRPWDEVMDDFLSVEPFDREEIIDLTISQCADWAGRGNSMGTAIVTLDTTLRRVVEWLNKQGHTAIARDLQRAGDI